MASIVWCLGAGTDVAAFAAGRQYWCGPLNANPSAVTAAWCRLMSISMLARLYGGICEAAGISSLSLLLSVSMAAVDAVSVVAVSRATTNEAVKNLTRIVTTMYAVMRRRFGRTGGQRRTHENRDNNKKKKKRLRAINKKKSINLKRKTDDRGLCCVLGVFVRMRMLCVYKQRRFGVIVFTRRNRATCKQRRPEPESYCCSGGVPWRTPVVAGSAPAVGVVEKARPVRTNGAQVPGAPPLGADRVTPLSSAPALE